MATKRPKGGSVMPRSQRAQAVAPPADTRTHDLAARLLGQPYASLNQQAQKVAQHVAQRQHIARNLALDDDQEHPDMGQRAADAVASFGGSWTFVGLFGLVLLVWIVLNAWLLAQRGSTFDPYPYILLNLVLSMLAAIQAPVILMSQNRQGEKDRQHADHDYEVNLKAEMEIMLLHEKLDELRQTQWNDLLKLQQQQLVLLAALTGKSASPPV